MVTKESIDSKYLKKHTGLEKEYYKDKKISKKVFDKRHGKLWKDWEQELKDNGLFVERI